jgi:hypothetical protein
MRFPDRPVSCLPCTRLLASREAAACPAADPVPAWARGPAPACPGDCAAGELDDSARTAADMRGKPFVDLAVCSEARMVDLCAGGIRIDTAGSIQLGCKWVAAVMESWDRVLEVNR